VLVTAISQFSNTPKYKNMLIYTLKHGSAGRGLVEEVIKGRVSVHPSRKIILFEQFAV